MDRFQIADLLDEIAAHLEFRGENPFKVRAYENGARVLRDLEEDLEGLVRSGHLRKQRGIGAALADKIATLATTGALPYLDELRAITPPELLSWTRIPGLGPRKALAIHEALGIVTLEALEAAARAGRLRTLRGMGPALEAKVLEGLQRLKRQTRRVLMPAGHAAAARLHRELARLPGARRVEIAGEVRRSLEVVGRIEAVMSADDPGAALETLAGLPGIREVLERTADRAEVRLASDLPATVRVVPDPRFTAALMEATGSEAHVAALRQRGLDAGDAFPDEAALYASLELPWIPPELREDGTEVAAAAQGKLPRLIERADLQGVLHVHSDWSDGRLSIADMAEAARVLGFTYLGLCDHSQSAGYAGGLSPARVRDQHAAIDALNARYGGAFRVLKGIEVDILADGALDYPDDVLASFEIVVASVHSRFSLPEAEQTVRVLRALENPHVDVLGHPTGRLLLAREPYAIDLVKVMEAAAEHGVAIEVNGHPSRLELDWRPLRAGLALGLRTSIDPDAHTADELHGVDWAVRIARKGWCTAEQALDAWPLPRLLDHLAARHA
ncbi:MAG TPA: helix-hairpin-helix domain-containing protein [Candidatus Polarisedimenticolaceae bacterium]|nr:helix-hairpin-helix domain-containing protein [Candidatus Polarisedimenticolaceae bacterium]